MCLTGDMAAPAQGPHSDEGRVSERAPFAAASARACTSARRTVLPWRGQPLNERSSIHLHQYPRDDAHRAASRARSGPRLSAVRAPMSSPISGAARPGWTAVTERLERWLRERGVTFRVMEHAAAATSEEAARARSTPIESGAKALVLLADASPVHVVLPANRRLDNARLRALLGIRTTRFATPEELLALTGCTPGAVPPFGCLFGLPALVDEALTRREHVVFSAGSHTVSISMRGDDFLRLAGPRVHALSRDAGAQR